MENKKMRLFKLMHQPMIESVLRNPLTNYDPSNELDRVLICPICSTYGLFDKTSLISHILSCQSIQNVIIRDATSINVKTEPIPANISPTDAITKREQFTEINSNIQPESINNNLDEHEFRYTRSKTVETQIKKSMRRSRCGRVRPYRTTGDTGGNR